MIRVLVVDDDFRVASVHAAVAGQVAGVEVVGQATTLAQAHELLAAGPVELILADEYLPDGSGTDLIGAADAAVILVTASDDPATVGRALVRGAAGYILKPFGLALLEQRIAEHVRFRESLAALGRPDQAAIDALLSGGRHRPGRPVPKGRSSVTASAVEDLLRDAEGPLTAAVVADSIGISRATAQRYLSDLADAGKVKVALRYGTAGRPEHSYVWVG